MLNPPNKNPAQYKKWLSDNYEPVLKHYYRCIKTGIIYSYLEVENRYMLNTEPQIVNFLHVPKCAGNSLVKIAGRKIEIWGHRQKYIVPSPSFCFVRDPYTRLISAYYYLLKGGNGGEPDQSYCELLKKYKDFDDFVMSIESDRLDKSVIHFKPMHHYICHDGEIMIDRVIKIEDPEAINAYLRSIGIGGDIRDFKENINDKKPERTEITKQAIQEIDKIYRMDFEIFNYPMQ